MEHFPDSFSITDLESFSGVKAHTIRAWEKRYAIMKPGRNGANVRSYDGDELRELLNVAFLVRHGTKISKVAKLNRQERQARVRELAEGTAGVEMELHQLQLAMLDYDAERFEGIARAFEEREGLKALLERLHLPMLQRIGTLWQSDTIRAGQEHMASNLIRQRIIAAIAGQEHSPHPDAPLCVLYLPEQELHELGLLYLHYLLRAEGCRTIYLGQGVPRGDLFGIAQRTVSPVTFIGVHSSMPRDGDVQRFINKLRKDVPQKNARFILSGGRMNAVQDTRLPEGVRIVADIREVPALLRL